MIFSYDKVAKQWGTGFKGLFEKITTNIKLPNKAMQNIFSQMDPNKVFSTQLADLASQGVVIPPEMYDTDKIDNYTASVTTAGQAMEAYGIKTQGTAGLLSNLGNIAGTVGSTLLTMGTTMLVMWGAGKIIGAITSTVDSIIHAKENAIKAAEETQDEIDAILSEGANRDTFANSEKYERAVELSSKITVSDGSYKNISATNEEYNEYISLCNEIAGIYPTVVQSYDSQGNAILNLGDNAKEATEKLSELNRQSQLVEGTELRGKINETWKGNKYKLSDAQDQIAAAQAAVDANNETIDLLTEANGESGLSKYINELKQNQGAIIETGSMELNEINELINDFYSAAEEANVSLTARLEKNTKDQGSYISVAINDYDSPEALQDFYNSLSVVIPEASARASSQIINANADLQSAISESDKILNEQLNNELELLTKLPGFVDVLDGKDSIQQAIKENFMGLKAEDIIDVGDDFEKWAEQNFLDPITYAFTNLDPNKKDISSAAQKAFSTIFADNFGEQTAEQYQQTLDANLEIIKDFYKSIGREDLYETFVKNFGFGTENEAGFMLYNSPDQILRILREKFPTETELVDSLGTELSFDQLVKVKDTVSNDSFIGTLKKVVDDILAEPISSPLEDTLTTLFNSEGYKESIETYESNLSTLSSSLETLRAEGPLTADEMVKLQESFPDMTEFTTESLSEKAFENLNDWIGKIREGMDSMSDEGIKQTQTYIQNLIDSYGDLDLTLDDIAKEYRNIQKQAIDENTIAGREELKGRQAVYESQVEQLRSDLAARGEELDTHVLYTIVAQDEFSGTAKEILDAYNNAKLHWEITLETRQLEEDIERQQATIEKGTAARELKQARGEDITSLDYGAELGATRRIEQDRRKEAENAWNKYLLSSGQERNATYKAWQEAQAEADQAEADAIAKYQESVEADANEQLNALEDSNSSLKQVQNKISDAEKDGSKASSQLYEDLASEYDNQAQLNRDLRDKYQEFANNATDEASRRKWQSQANDYDAAAIQAEADEIEQKLIPGQTKLNDLQQKSEDLQRSLTVAEQKHQKVSKSTYAALIKNGRDQIKVLQDQQAKVGDNIDKWQEYQDQIDSISDSIYDWGQTMDGLVVAQASDLASTVSTAISESMSGTGLSTETINSLTTAFSDLTGKDYNISDVFYASAEGIKVNTAALQEMTDAEYDMISANLSSEMERIQSAMSGLGENTSVWSNLNEQLQTLTQTAAQFESQYNEIRDQLSHNSRMDIADSTVNQGAAYDKNYDRLKNITEAVDKGLVGTDDVQEFFAYVDEYGRNTIEAWNEGAKAKAERYLTEDASTGMNNFLQDLQSFNLAEQDAEGTWMIKVDDMNEAAHQLGIGANMFEDMFGKLEEYGFELDFIDSDLEHMLNIDGLEGSLKEQLQIYNDMLQNGATQDALDKQMDTINGIAERMGRVNEYAKTRQEVEEQNSKKAFVGLEDHLSDLSDAYDKAAPEARDAIIEQAKADARAYGMTLNEERAKAGTFELSKESKADYDSRIPKQDFFGETFNSLAQQMQQLGEGGNVDLLARPLIDAAKLAEAGWKDAGEGIATVFSSTYSNADENLAMNFTPIITDENGNFKGVLSPDELQTYAEGVIDGVHDDYLNLQMGAEFTGEDAIDQAVSAADKIHELQEDYYLDLSQFEPQFLGTEQEEGFKNFEQYYNNNTKAANEYLSILSKVPRDTLEKISLSNGDYEIDKDVEDAFQGLADSLGYTNENASELLDIIGLLGIDLSKVQLPDETTQDLQTFIDSTEKGSGAKYQISTDYQNLSTEQLQAQLPEIENLQLQIDPSSEIYAQLEELKQNIEIELNIRSKIESGDLNMEEIRRLISSGAGVEEVAARLKIDTSTDEGMATVKRIMEMSETGYDFKVSIDDQQFVDLLTTITSGELPEAYIKVKADDKEFQTTLQKDIDAAHTEVSTGNGVHAGGGSTTGYAYKVGSETKQSEQPQIPQKDYAEQVVKVKGEFDPQQVQSDINDFINNQNPYMNINVGATTTEAEGAINEVEQEAESSKVKITPEVVISKAQSIISGFIQRAQASLSKLTAPSSGSQQQTQASASIDTSGVEKGAQEVSKDMKKIGQQSATTTVTVDTSQANAALAGLRANLSAISGIRPMPIVDSSSISNAINRAQTLINKLNEAAAKKVASGTAFSLGSSHANGTVHTTALSHSYAGGTQDWTVGSDETALVNEIGQESIVRDGVWSLLPGGPHVMDLQANDIIFNAEQTADLIRTGKTARSGKLVAHANGTASGIPAFSGGGKGNIKSNTKSSNRGNKGGGGNGGSKGKGKGKGGNSKSDKKQNAFEGWLERLFDWVEVRLDRIQRRIDIATTSADNAIAGFANGLDYLNNRPSNNKAGYQNKNDNLDVAMAENYSLIQENKAGYDQYMQTANEVLSKAATTKVKHTKANGKQTKKKVVISNPAEIAARVADGKIDVSQYSKETQAAINAYKEWVDKALECQKAQEELIQQRKELQQQKLDNITEEFETWTGYAEAVKTASEATAKYYTTIGKAVNASGLMGELNSQLGRQNEVTSYLNAEREAYDTEMKNALQVFGENSNEYRNAQIQLAEIDKSIQESRTAALELQHTIEEVPFKLRDLVISRLSSFVSQLSSIAQLIEKRGTVVVGASSAYATNRDTMLRSNYQDQMKYNNSLVQKYYEDFQARQAQIIKELKAGTLEINSERYQELYEDLQKSQTEMINLLSANEDLKKSIRELNWKPFEDWLKTNERTSDELEHIRGFIREEEKYTKEGEITDRGWADVALIGEGMYRVEQRVSSLKEAREKLNEEFKNGTISKEEYEEKDLDYLQQIQDLTKQLMDTQQDLADIQIESWSRQLDYLQELIEKQKDALSSKKAYYDYDKQLKQSNKDVTATQASLAAISGSSGDAMKAERARLQAQLAEKQEDLADLRYNHQIDLMQNGYDKLSEDMQEAFDNAVRMIQSDNAKLQQVANDMLSQLRTNKVNEANIIHGIIDTRGTDISERTKEAINASIGTGISGLDLSAKSIAQQINGVPGSDTIHGIQTRIETALNNDGKSVSKTISDIWEKVNTNFDKKFSEVAADMKANNGGGGSGGNSTPSASSSSQNANQRSAFETEVAGIRQQIAAQEQNLANHQAAQAALHQQAIELEQKAANAKKKSKQEKYLEKELQVIAQIQDYDNAIQSIKTQIQELNDSIALVQRKYGFASGTKRVTKDQLAWTNENFMKNGGEMIVRPSDGAILTPLKTNDAVIPADLVSNLFKWGAINPDSFATNPFMGKWGDTEGSNNKSDVFSNNTSTQNINVHFDSLFHVEGNVDANVASRLEDLAKSLTKNKDFQKNVINFVTKDFVKESRKQGFY